MIEIAAGILLAFRPLRDFGLAVERSHWPDRLKAGEERRPKKQRRVWSFTS